MMGKRCPPPRSRRRSSPPLASPLPRWGGCCKRCPGALVKFFPRELCCKILSDWMPPRSGPCSAAPSAPTRCISPYLSHISLISARPRRPPATRGAAAKQPRHRRRQPPSLASASRRFPRGRSTCAPSLRGEGTAAGRRRWTRSDGHADSHELDALQSIVGDAPQPSK